MSSKEEGLMDQHDSAKVAKEISAERSWSAVVEENETSSLVQSASEITERMFAMAVILSAAGSA